MMSAGQRRRISLAELNSLALSPRGTQKRRRLPVKKLRKQFARSQSGLSGLTIHEENDVFPIRLKKSFKNSICLEEKPNDDQKLYATAPTSPAVSSSDEKF